jgi:hypothetical protein
MTRVTLPGSVSRRYGCRVVGGGGAATAHSPSSASHVCMAWSAARASPGGLDRSPDRCAPHSCTDAVFRRPTECSLAIRFLDAAFSSQSFDVQRMVEQGDTVVLHFRAPRHPHRGTDGAAGNQPGIRQRAHPHLAVRGRPGRRALGTSRPPVTDAPARRPGWIALTPPEVCWYPNRTSLCIEFDRRMGNLDFRFVACCGSGALCR